eukprot:CAMPEP_0194030176 /NCGR_PEP_ID=MMETSP0009_2-20130614/3754_1 /TAXON_ID=210454 /ORGANISM="Grammatophora oceanica, Strain CCMP 410" /LENGTH=430 /DNA_ID=CAMNT_0038670079 /DNA_START=33 /DNA_END=1325 /DNA_ORIENTATION=+
MKLSLICSLSVVLAVCSVRVTDANGWVPSKQTAKVPDRTVPLQAKSDESLVEIKTPSSDVLSRIVGGAKKVATAATNSDVLWGNIGNLATALLSAALLMATPFNVDATSDACAVCEPPEYSGKLDPCYACDGFCISNPESTMLNSHMLSLYADVIATVPLIALRLMKGDTLDKLGLSEFYLSWMKIFSVTGHGIAHLGLSILTVGMPDLDLANDNSRLAVFVTALLARFVNRDSLNAINEGIARIQGKAESFKPQETKGRKTVLRSAVAPILSHVSFAQWTASRSLDRSDIFSYILFTGTCFLFFEAGTPAGSTTFAFLAALLVAKLATGHVGNVQQSFVVVFTSAYLVSALYQVFAWKDKDEHPFAYKTTAMYSNLLTTLVGWLIALSCSSLKALGGHVLYDISIPVSYFILYYMTLNKSNENAAISKK